MRDAASTMKKAIEDLNYQHFDCFLHKIALAVNDATEHRTKAVVDVKKQIQICRELVAFYNRSSEFQRTLLRQQQLIDAPQNILIRDVPTRWNSILTMFNRLVEQQRSLLIASVEYNNVVLPDFELLKKISKILHSFALDSTIEKEMKQVISNGLKNRMEEHTDKSFLVIATLVDPRYKNKGSIFNAAQRMRNRLLICSEIVQCLNPVNARSPAHSFVNGENNDDPMGQFLSASCEEEHLATNLVDYPNVEEEVDAYFKASTEKLTIDPIEFWKNSSMYPNLKKIAKIYLSCPPSSVESERTFSRLSSIENFKRSRLTSQHAKEQLFLLFNFDE